MEMLHTTIAPNLGSRKTSKRVGRWDGSGKGNFSGRGCKWQNARTGGWVGPWFEWGQTPLFRRMPKNKGFKNYLFQEKYNIVNLDTLEVFWQSGVTTIDAQVLLEKKIIKQKNLPLKVLWNGKLSSKITVKADKFSKSAQEAIEKAGGIVEIISL
jgi:large subunit ribosomal protein L15